MYTAPIGIKQYSRDMKNTNCQNKFKYRIDFTRDLRNHLPENGKGVEVGVYRGQYSRQILENWNGTLYMVDVWGGSKSNDNDYDKDINENSAGFLKDTMDSISGYEDRGIIIRATSKIAAEMFEDESLDFVYIDANHSYDFVKEDIQLWFPKLKKGGIFSGHDYIGLDWYSDTNFLPNGKDKKIWSPSDIPSFTQEDNVPYNGVFGVNPAIDEFFKENKKLTFNVTDEWFGTWWTVK